jgi:membrane protease YdiL (CAAX protease family)
LYLAANAAGLRLPAVSLSGESLVKVLLLSPVLEELIFRGGVQTLLDRTVFGARLVVRGVTVGNVLTSALFAAAHLWVAPPALAAAIFLPSLVFGRLRQLYPSLLPAVIVHGVYNACYLATGMAWATRP